MLPVHLFCIIPKRISVTSLKRVNRLGLRPLPLTLVRKEIMFQTVFRFMSHVRGVPVTTAWLVLGLQMEEMASSYGGLL
jgi:hypothetical protein